MITKVLTKAKIVYFHGRTIRNMYGVDVPTEGHFCEIGGTARGDYVTADKGKTWHGPFLRYEDAYTKAQELEAQS